MAWTEPLAILTRLMTDISDQSHYLYEEDNVLSCADLNLRGRSIKVRVLSRVTPRLLRNAGNVKALDRLPRR
jgi:hypothetical protein